MTDRIETLRSLQTRIRESKGADRELDWDIAFAFQTYTGFDYKANRAIAAYYTTDPDGLGACVALMRKVLPGWRFDIRQQHVEDFQARVHRIGRYDVFASHRLATHAALLTIIAAVIAEEEAKQTEKA